jgi:hypothetical protein
MKRLIRCIVAWLTVIPLVAFAVTQTAPAANAEDNGVGRAGIHQLLGIADASTWQQYANGWRTGGDIEDYGAEPSGSSYPLTDLANVESRFNQVARWQPDGEPGAFNDYDSIEVGNGSDDGLTYDERQTQLSLWSLASSPLILGTDLTNLNRTDLGPSSWNGTATPAAISTR